VVSIPAQFRPIGNRFKKGPLDFGGFFLLRLVSSHNFTRPPHQERVVRLLSQAGADICIVGDDDQTIYQWRGGDITNIITFEKRDASVVTDPASRELAAAKDSPDTPHTVQGN
jgi:hypothetical protein